MRSILAGAATSGTKIVAAQPEPLRGIGDGDAVIAARGGDHAGRRRLPRQQVGEGAARLERAGVLQQFKLQHEALAVEPEIGGIDPDDRRAPDIGPDQPLGFGDAITIDGRRHFALPDHAAEAAGNPAPGRRRRRGGTAGVAFSSG